VVADRARDADAARRRQCLQPRRDVDAVAVNIAAVGDHVAESIDTLLVAGCPNAAEMSPAPAVINWLRQVAPATRRYGSVCSGAFFLAATGLLDGKRVTPHWAVADQLAPP